MSRYCDRCGAAIHVHIGEPVDEIVCPMCEGWDSGYNDAKAECGEEFKRAYLFARKTYGTGNVINRNNE
jgi:hypothetical protein|tara:strand:+ start:4166 stop:4372 length:207 start_codon:yes stop_codon:yes gene_type:complete